MFENLREDTRPIIENLFAVDSLWSVVIRFVIWGIIAFTIIASVDGFNARQGTRNLKSNLGLLLLFFILSGILIYLLFGFIPSF